MICLNLMLYQQVAIATQPRERVQSKITDSCFFLVVGRPFADAIGMILVIIGMKALPIPLLLQMRCCVFWYLRTGFEMDQKFPPDDPFFREKIS